MEVRRRLPCTAPATHTPLDLDPHAPRDGVAAGAEQVGVQRRRPQLRLQLLQLGLHLGGVLQAAQRSSSDVGSGSRGGVQAGRLNAYR